MTVTRQDCLAMMSQWLVTLLRNFAEWVHHFPSTLLLTTGESDSLLSFDVVSLSQRYPEDEVLQLTKNLLTPDPTLEDRTAVPSDDVCTLVGSAYDSPTSVQGQLL